MKQLFISAVLLVSFTGSAQERNFIDQPYLEVSGSADSMVTPDEIYIKILITEKSTKDKIPLQEMERSMYERFNAIGVNTEKDLRVHDMASTFKTYLLKANTVMKSREYILIVKDANTAGKVFIELEKLDIGTSNIFAVNHTGINDIKNLLRSKAVKNAKERAVALTSPLGQSVGHALHIEEREQYNNIGISNTNINAGGGRASNTMTEMYIIDKPIDIDFTKITIRSHVNIKFALK